MVIWTQPAKADLRSIHDFIAHDSRHYAKKVVQDIREKTDNLEQLPKRGKKIPELNDDQVRELSLYSYRIIYEIKERGIFVLAVVHKSRDLKVDDISRD
ncbi:MAG: type II toxin-antitoxin system RelE/ParE family toxin [Chromatiaceae bacterium]|nr:type II toxin-antitoxin system RelE/ParE family toxin [Chromatiaceae bacterium]